MRNAISIVLLLLLFILTPVVLIVNSAQRNVVTTSFIKRELVELDVYGLAATRIDEQINTISIDPQYPITNAEIAALTHQVLSSTWLRQNIESILDHINLWLHQPRGTLLSLPIDLRQPKQQLTTGLDTLLAAKLPQIQPCPDPRVPKEEQGICQFSGLTLAQLKEQLKRQGLNPELVSTLLPDTLDLLNPDLSTITGPNDAADQDSAATKGAEIREKLEQFKSQYQRVAFLINWAFVINVLLFLLFLAINGVKGWHRLARWGGVGFFIIGILPFALAISSGPLVENFLLPKINLDKTPADIAGLVPELIHDARIALTNPLLIIGSLCLAFGLGGIIGAHWIRQPAATQAKGKQSGS